MAQLRSVLQRLKEQIALLDVEENDNNSIVAALQRKIREQRGQLDSVLQGQHENFNNELKIEQDAFIARMNGLKGHAQRLTEEKITHLQESQQLVSAVNALEIEIGNDEMAIRKQQEKSSEAERRLFADQQDERVQKVVAAKLFEMKEQTARGLQPEISRLQQLHEREVADVELNARAQELALTQDHNNQLSVTKETERAAAFENRKEMEQRVMLIASKEIKELEDYHRSKCDDLTSIKHTELEKIRRALEMRNEREKSSGLEQIALMKSQMQTTLKALLAQHARDLSALRADIVEESGDSMHGGELRPCDSDDEDVGTIDMSKLKNERDKRIQAEIKTLQIESIRQERTLKEQYEAFRKSALIASKEESSVQSVRSRNISARVVELVAKRESLRSAHETLKRAFDADAVDWNAKRSELHVVEANLHEAQAMLRTLEYEFDQFQRNLTGITTGVKGLGGVKERLTQLRGEMVQLEKKSQTEMKCIADSHGLRLSELHNEAKSLIAVRDQRRRLLQDDVNIELAKHSRLGALIDKHELGF